jgi:UDP-N-acetylglucosamine 2-epimerase
MLATLITYYLTFKKIIQKHEIKVVYLVSLGGFYESLLLGAAYKLDRKVVHSPHGYGDRYFIVHKKLIKNVSFIAAGNEDRRRLLKLKIKDENVLVVGSPFFDKIPEYRKRRQKIDKKTVVLLTQPLVEEGHVEEKIYFNCVRRFLTQINKVGEVGKIIIKLHPREKFKQKYESITESMGLGNTEVTQASGKEALYSILNKSDLLISYGSTTDIEGLIFDKDVINIDGLKRGPLAELAKRDKYRVAVLAIDKDEDLAGTVTKMFTDKRLVERLRQKRREYVADYFYKVDGKAHERVADRIKILVRLENSKLT